MMKKQLFQQFLYNPAFWRSGEKALSGCHCCRFFWFFRLAFKDLNIWLLQYKATVKLLSHLPRDRRDPHRIVSLCLFQLLKHLRFNSYLNQLTLTIKFKLFPAMSTVFTSAGNSLIFMVNSILPSVGMR